MQIGITLVGVFAGPFGGTPPAQELVGPIGKVAWLALQADKIAFALVVGVITCFSLMLGKRVPKRFGLSNPEGTAMRVARPMNWLSKLADPGGASPVCPRMDGCACPPSNRRRRRAR